MYDNLIRFPTFIVDVFKYFTFLFRVYYTFYLEGFENEYHYIFCQ